MIESLLAQVDPANAVILGALWYRIERTVVPRVRRLEQAWIDGQNNPQN